MYVFEAVLAIHVYFYFLQSFQKRVQSRILREVLKSVFYKIRDFAIRIYFVNDF